MAKQSTKDRELRLNEGRCPIHGLTMNQVTPWYESNGVEFTVVACPRKDCEIKAKAFDIEGPWELLPEFDYLLNQNSKGTAKIYEFKKPNT